MEKLLLDLIYPIVYYHSKKSKLPPRSFPFFDDRWKMEQLWKVEFLKLLLLSFLGCFFYSNLILHGMRKRKKKVFPFFLYICHTSQVLIIYKTKLFFSVGEKTDQPDGAIITFPYTFTDHIIYKKKGVVQYHNQPFFSASITDMCLLYILYKKKMKVITPYNFFVFILMQIFKKNNKGDSGKTCFCLLRLINE